MSDPYKKRIYQRNRKQMLSESDVCSVVGCPRPATTADHITALAYGGGHNEANLRPMCKHHNSQLGARITNERKAAKKIGRRSRRW